MLPDELRGLVAMASSKASRDEYNRDTRIYAEQVNAELLAGRPRAMARGIARIFNKGDKVSIENAALHGPLTGRHTHDHGGVSCDHIHQGEASHSHTHADARLVAGGEDTEYYSDPSGVQTSGRFDGPVALAARQRSIIALNEYRRGF